MTILLALALATQVTLDTKEVGKDALVSASITKSADVPVFVVFRRIGTMKRTLKGMQLSEAWHQEVLELASSRKGAWTGDALLSRPGRYDIHIGLLGSALWVSRSGFGSWENELRELRGLGESVTRVAAAMDAEGSPASAQVASWERDLRKAKARLSALETEFDASREALRDAIDRLLLLRTLTKYAVGKLTAEDDEGYKAGELRREEKATAARQVEGLASVLQREGTVKLLDELILVLGPDGDIKRLNRWKDAGSAVSAIAQARQLLGGPPELVDLLNEAKEGKDPSSVVRKAGDLRLAQVE